MPTLDKQANWMLSIWLAVFISCLFIDVATACFADAPSQDASFCPPGDDPLSLLQTRVHLGSAAAPRAGVPWPGRAGEPEPPRAARLPGVQARSILGGHMDPPLEEQSQDVRAVMTDIGDREAGVQRAEERLDAGGQSPKALNEAEAGSSRLIKELQRLQAEQQQEIRRLQDQDGDRGSWQQDHKDLGQEDGKQGVELVAMDTQRSGAFGAGTNAELVSELLGEMQLMPQGDQLGLDGRQQQQQQQQQQEQQIKEQVQPDVRGLEDQASDKTFGQQGREHRGRQDNEKRIGPAFLGAQQPQPLVTQTEVFSNTEMPGEGKGVGQKGKFQQQRQDFLRLQDREAYQWLGQQGRQHQSRQDYEQVIDPLDSGSEPSQTILAPPEVSSASEELAQTREGTMRQGGWEGRGDRQRGSGVPSIPGFSPLPASQVQPLPKSDAGDKSASTVVSPGLQDILDAAIGTSSDKDCTPQCRWQCDDPRCDEVCKPVCAPPKCETRCGTPDISKCTMDCTQAHCAVVCPKTKCPKAKCAHCSTTCSEPLCTLRCPDPQPCRNVCEEPACEWSCSAPQFCPAPKCSMICEHPKDCLGSTHQEMPDLLPGEVSVGAFAAQSATGQNATATLTLLGEDGRLQRSIASLPRRRKV